MSSHLSMYLRAHVTGSKLAEGIARRLLASDGDGELQAALGSFVHDVIEERAVVRSLIHVVQGEPDLLSRGSDLVSGVVTALSGFGSALLSPGRSADLEALAVGVRGKMSLWTTLRILADVDSRVQGPPYEQLLAQAEAQERSLLRLRDAAVVSSLAPSGAGADR
jgi:hypothetical protein